MFSTMPPTAVGGIAVCRKNFAEAQIFSPESRVTGYNLDKEKLEKINCH
jgi:hypothetical protein